MQPNIKQEYFRNYIGQISQLVNQIITLQTQKQLFQHLSNFYQIDRQFMAASEIYCKGHMLFTRHGQSNNWGQKTFGLYPNSQISQEAILAMTNTHELSKALFCFPSKIPVVRVSPMIRAKQTASLVLPATLKYNIKIQACLTENSSKPSGAFIISLEQLKHISQQASFLDNPKKVISYKLSEIFYNDNTVYQRLQNISSQTDKKLIKLSQEEGKAAYFCSESDEKSKQYCKYLESLTKEQKVERIKKIIQQTFEDKACDLWFIGHSKNLRSFFKAEIGQKSEFCFGQTRRVYKIINKNGEEHYFIPPYKFIVDQQTGRIRVKMEQKKQVIESVMI